ncbi:MAG: tellurite resistance/C4-dicarboxylate transporter family protein [Candidatus Omnitrophica bacterium]|nr:tellurite resistance/C4-dicarboxylate transporter family protein [Candidatus Omnitrophota bacterium]
MIEKIKSAVAKLFPGYFALVMSTGIISVACSLLGLNEISRGLFVINQVCYVILSLLLVLRVVFYFPHVAADLQDHTRGTGFFTIIAGTCILGTQFVLLNHDYAMGMMLLVLGFVFWGVIIYTLFGAMTMKASKPDLETGINGSWSIAVVSTQSISILGTLLATHKDSGILFFISLCLFFVGCMLYIPIISLIFYRFLFFRLQPQDLQPPYWINMGAVAITTLAGSVLMLHAEEWSFLNEILGFLKGFTLFFWAFGVWWIPLLIILGIWRHVYCKVSFQYNPQYWGMVFPLGMFTTCTFQLSKALDLNFLMVIPRYFIYIALFAWLLTFWGMVKNLIIQK